MATEGRSSTTQSWQAPVFETAEEKSKRELREQQSRFFIECIKEAIRELADERKGNKEVEEDWLSKFLKGK